ncbi:hypothetical protein APB40_33520 [Pseudomonas aeruginosa]|nr:hypothetical protein APB40_33520 [Pseudomonas aeruginosa]OPD71153.1 hypothetical protein AO899_33485 [Pseudomonas aeruginosa]
MFIFPILTSEHGGSSAGSVKGARCLGKGEWFSELFALSVSAWCSGQPIPDSGLSFSSATAGGSPSLN